MYCEEDTNPKVLEAFIQHKKDNKLVAAEQITSDRVNPRQGGIN